MINDDSFVIGPYKNRAVILAKDLLQNAGITSAPVSLRQIIENLQKSRDVTFKRVPDFSTKVSGLLVVCSEVDSDYAVVGYNGKHPWCRRRFTIGHEIGHLLMGHACDPNSGQNSDNETEANVFSSELLIPTELLKKDYKKYPDIPTLSKLYLVSAEAMSYKLMSARLLKI